jgi:epoxyqueuosine reductase
VLTSEAIKQRAKEIGFDLCGVAPAAAFPELAFLREWIDRGYAGTMAYLPRTARRRTDVREVVSTARSVIVLGTIYNTGRPYSTENTDRAKAQIARYATADDYHDVLAGRMEVLLEWMRSQAPEPFDARAYVDTGPVQERIYAQYAGLGWIGKNSCVIHPDAGSWFLISEIIISLPLEADAPSIDQCGTCTLCLEACPTQAFAAPHELDATKCISYLTIEYRGTIPDSFREPMGNHVFGCDICQEVCPWNNSPATTTQDPLWSARADLAERTLGELSSKTDDELAALIAGTPLTRAGVRGLRRNLAMVNRP